MSEPINTDLIGQLSKLSPTDEEQKTLEGHLSSIVEYVGVLQKVDTGAVTHSHRQALTSETLRSDVVVDADEETRTQIIENFPHAKGALLKSPEVFE